jgi:hypothetical protein
MRKVGEKVEADPVHLQAPGQVGKCTHDLFTKLQTLKKIRKNYSMNKK